MKNPWKSRHPLFRVHRVHGIQNDRLDLTIRGAIKKKTQYIYRHCPNWWWPPSLLPYFWQIYFWQSVDHVDLPPSPRIFDKNHEILGFETCILFYPHYFLRVRGTDRMTQSPFWARLSNKSYKIEWFYFWQYVLWPPPSPTFVKNSFIFNFLTWGWPPSLLFGQCL